MLYQKIKRQNHSKHQHSIVLRILIVLLFINLQSYSQSTIDGLTTLNKIKTDSFIESPFNSNGDYQTWAIKGKVLPFPIGNGELLNALLGLEYGFLKNQSIGIDCYYFILNGNDDNYKLGQNHEKDLACFINYRYYLPLNKIRDKHKLYLYIGAFGRYGTNHYDAFGTEAHDSTESSLAKHYSAGFLLGTLYKIGKKRLCIDFNLGFYKKQTTLTNTNYPYHQAFPTIINSNYSTYNIRVGLNLYWYFIRNKRS